MSIPYKQIQNFNERLVLERLDELINILLTQQAIFDTVLRGLVAGVVPMAPAFSQTIVVGATPTLLVENTVMSLMKVEITNDDIAVPLYVGNRDVIVPAGRLIQPGNTIFYNLRKGQKLYGTVAVGAINVIISFSESTYQAVTEDGPLIM